MAEMRVAMAILAGPIKYWWDDNWDTPAHWHYDAWREALSQALVDAGVYLVYRPHHAFKGTWTERGQVVNDAALQAADLVIDMTPPGVPSEGTDSEILQASSYGAIIVQAPPPAHERDFTQSLRQLVEYLATLGVHRPMVDQSRVLECIGWLPGREWMFTGLAHAYDKHVIRLHYIASNNRLVVDDTTDLNVETASGLISFNGSERRQTVSLHSLLKAEALERLAA